MDNSRVQQRHAFVPLRDRSYKSYFGVPIQRPDETFSCKTLGGNQAADRPLTNTSFRTIVRYPTSYSN